jgi:hypothetical protein
VITNNATSAGQGAAVQHARARAYTSGSPPALLARGVAAELLLARGVSRRLSQLLRDPQILMCFSQQLRLVERRRSQLLHPPPLPAWSQLLPRLFRLPKPCRAPPRVSLPVAADMSIRTGRGTPPGPIRVAHPVAAGLRPEPNPLGTGTCLLSLAAAWRSSKASSSPCCISAVGFCHHTGRTKLCGRLSGCSASRLLLFMYRLWKLCCPWFPVVSALPTRVSVLHALDTRVTNDGPSATRTLPGC